MPDGTCTEMAWVTPHKIGDEIVICNDDVSHSCDQRITWSCFGDLTGVAIFSVGIFSTSLFGDRFSPFSDRKSFRVSRNATRRGTKAGVRYPPASQ